MTQRDELLRMCDVLIGDYAAEPHRDDDTYVLKVARALKSLLTRPEAQGVESILQTYLDSRPWDPFPSRAGLDEIRCIIEIALSAASPSSEQEGFVSDLPQRVLAMCKKRGWSLHWTARGAYLHLEASELIEAIRGKRGSPAAEAADVLIVLLSITEHNGIPFSDVIEQARQIVEHLEIADRYAGEEYAAQEGVTKP